MCAPTIKNKVYIIEYNKEKALNYMSKTFDVPREDIHDEVYIDNIDMIFELIYGNGQNNDYLIDQLYVIDADALKEVNAQSVSEYLALTSDYLIVTPYGYCSRYF